jgi:hypothetical protein
MNFYYNTLSDIEQKKLRTKFNKLTTIESKFNFWREELKASYSNRGFIDYSTWVNFKIQSNSVLDIAEINKRCIEEMRPFISNRKDSHFKIVDFNKLVSEFNNDILQNATNKTNAIKLQLDKLNEEIQKIKTLENNKQDYLLANSIQFFTHSFDEYYLNNTEEDYTSQIYNDKINLVMLNNGYQYAKYKLYLEDLLIPQKKKNIVTLSEITTNQQLLFFHYTDYLNTFDLNTNRKAELLATLFNKGSENYRKGLTNISSLKTRNNLEFLNKLFDKFGLSKLSEQVKKDIAKLKTDKD